MAPGRLVYEGGAKDPDGYVKVRCEHCDELLGYVPEGTPVDNEHWAHVRCMARVAKQWAVDVDVVNAYRDILATSLYTCYPDLGGTEELRLMRAKIAAEVTLETLASNELRVVAGCEVGP